MKLSNIQIGLIAFIILGSIGYFLYYRKKSKNNTGYKVQQPYTGFCYYREMQSFEVGANTKIPLDIISWSHNSDVILQLNGVSIGRLGDYLYSNNVINNLSTGNKLTVSTPATLKGYVLNVDVKNKNRISKLPLSTLLETIGCEHVTDVDDMGNYLI